MSFFVRELLFDLANNNIVSHANADDMLRKGMGIAWEYLGGWEKQCEFRCDIVQALQVLVNTRQVDSTDILVLRDYIYGTPIERLDGIYNAVKERLIRTLALLEYESGYTDAKYVDMVISKYPKYAENAAAYRERIHQMGRLFE